MRERWWHLNVIMPFLADPSTCLLCVLRRPRGRSDDTNPEAESQEYIDVSILDFVCLCIVSSYNTGVYSLVRAGV